METTISSKPNHGTITWAGTGTGCSDVINVLSPLMKEPEALPKATEDCKRPSGGNAAKPTIEKVIQNGPATIVLWSDKTKTMVKCSECKKKGKPCAKCDKPRKTLDSAVAHCIAKKFYPEYRKVVRRYAG